MARIDGNIFVVDDTEENLSMIASILGEEVSKIFFFSSGAEAFEGLKKIIPDLILLDVMMPEMDGYEVCRILKKGDKTKDISIIFLTAKNETEDIVKGFQLGSIDYITKPFKKEELLARVRTHLKLALTEKSLKESLLEKEQLLDETLKGSIKVLIEILASINPEVFTQTLRVRGLAKRIFERLNLKDTWEIEIGILLSHIGCAGVPFEILQKKFLDHILTDEETIVFASHPLLGSKLISNIPRLERIAESIKNQIYDYNKKGKDRDLIKDFIRLLFDYDYLLQSGKPLDEILERLSKKVEKYNSLIFEALEAEARHTMKGFLVKSIYLVDLKVGMVLADDIRSEKNIILIRTNSEISEVILEKILNYNRFDPVSEPIKILEPSSK